jgi:hypothetical protein
VRLAGVKPGDIVRVAGSHALVTGRRPRRVQIAWLTAAAAQQSSRRWCKAGEVEAHWRRVVARERAPASGPTDDRAAAEASWPHHG